MSKSRSMLLIFHAFQGSTFNMTCGISHIVLNNGGITVTRIIEGIPLYHEEISPQSPMPF